MLISSVFWHEAGVQIFCLGGEGGEANSMFLSHLSYSGNLLVVHCALTILQLGYGTQMTFASQWVSWNLATFLLSLQDLSVSVSMLCH